MYGGVIMKRYSFTILMVLVVSTAAVAQETQPAELEKPPRKVVMQGIVFEDRDSDGVRDSGEPVLADMPVSDGIDIIKTGSKGAFTFELDESVSGTVFVCTPAGWRASGNFYVIADFAGFDGKTQEADIGLVRDPSRLADRFQFVQLTDTHVTDAQDRIQTFIEDLEVVNRITDPITFVAATGDLTDRGYRQVEFESYYRAIQTAKLPIYNVIGNHDYNNWARKIKRSKRKKKNPKAKASEEQYPDYSRHTENYERFLGPRWYSFDVGRIHFIARDSMAVNWDSQANKNQEAWIRKDIALNAKGKKIIVLQHFLPTQGDLEWWSQFDTLAIFSGHWHGRRERIYKGIHDINTSTFRFGGIDRSPRGFRIVHVGGDRLRSEFRVGQQNKRAEIIHPPMDGTASGDSIEIRVLAYDTALRVKEVRYQIMEAKRKTRVIARGKLAPQGPWSWVGQGDLPSNTKPGPKYIRADVIAADGQRWQTDGTFNLIAEPPPHPVMGEEWLFFHGDAGHRGFAETGPQPPLTLAWAANAGGSIHIASPVIADGRVYIGTHFNESFDDCAVVAMDLKSGQVLWRAPVDSSIKHGLAVWKDNVLAVSQTGTLYCFDTHGQPRWSTKMAQNPEHHWDLSFPVTDGKMVYAGRATAFGAYNLSTGEPIWRQAEGSPWWPNLYSGPSLGTSLVYRGGTVMSAYDRLTGEPLWKLPKTTTSTVAVVPAVIEKDERGDRLYIFKSHRTHNGALQCLDGQTGETIWEGYYDPSQWGKKKKGKEVVPLGSETGTPAVGEKVVCLGTSYVWGPGDNGPTATMRGFDKQNGQLLWRFEVGKGLISSAAYLRNESTITSSPVIVGKVVYFGANDGYLYALDADSGKKIWSFRLGVPISSTVAVTGNTVVIGALDGNVYAFTAQPR